jgi:multiple antibiotic resistance protein
VLRLAGGVILFLVAIRTVLDQFGAPEPSAVSDAAGPQTTLQLALRPLAFPGIVTPYGIAALVVFLAFSQSVEARLTIAAVVLGILALDLVFMLAARRLRIVFALVLPVLGAVLGVVQVALGLQIINVALRAMRVI